MDALTAHSKLTDLIDIPCSYGGKLWRLENFAFNEDNDRINLKTYQGNIYNKAVEDFEVFLNQIIILNDALPVEEEPKKLKSKKDMKPPPTKHEQEIKNRKPTDDNENTETELAMSHNTPSVKNSDTELFSEGNNTVTLGGLKEILMENINKVQKDAKYIPQATTICENVNGIINLAKLSIQLEDRQRKLSKLTK